MKVPATAFDIVPVALVGTERLVPPTVGTQLAFRPPEAETIDADDDSAQKATCFFVSVYTAEPERLRARITDVDSGAWSALTAVAPPASASERDLAVEPRSFNTETHTHLLAGRGVFWTGDPEPGGLGGTARVGLLLPENLVVPMAKLTLFVTDLGDTPVAAAELELVQGFFYIAVIGDSVQWGNGLREQDKMSTLVREVIEQETQRKVILQRYAHSGARIMPAEGDAVCSIGCFGEAPTVSTSITR